MNRIAIMGRGLRPHLINPTASARQFSSPAVATSPENVVVVSQLQTTYKIIKPLFQVQEYPVDPKLFTIDCSEYDLVNGPKPDKLIAQMKQTYNDVGLVLLVNTGLRSMAQMKSYATSILAAGGIIYKGGANPRKQVDAKAANVYDVGAPNEAWLHYHHEMAYLGKSPKYLSLFCKEIPNGYGWTYVSDSVQATDDILNTDFGQKLKELNVCYVRNLTDKEYYKDKDQSMVYNHWQDSFGTTDMDEVVPIAEERGLKVEWDIRGNNRFCKTKYYVSAFEYFPEMDRNILYSSVADDFMWFDSWPGIDTTPIDDRPLRLTFGDDSDMTQEEKQLFVDVYDKYGFPIRWNPGDVSVMCNYRWAHGRPGFTVQPGEKRELGVFIGDTFDRVGHVEGKW